MTIHPLPSRARSAGEEGAQRDRDHTTGPSDGRPSDDPQVNAWFHHLRTSRDPAVRARLIEHHLRLAVRLARQFEGRGLPVDDLIQVASMALVQAVDRYDPERGSPFIGFAKPTILGELKRHFRDKGWMVRVPRGVQETHLRLGQAIALLAQDLGRMPTLAELAAQLDLPLELVREASLAPDCYLPTSLHQRVTGPQGTSSDLVSFLGADDAQLERSLQRDTIDWLLLQLPARDALIVRLRFDHDMRQAEIADLLDISQMHVSRRLQQCLARMRRLLLDSGAAGPTRQAAS